MLCLDDRFTPSSWIGRVMYIYSSRCQVIRALLAPTVGLSHDGFEFLKGSFDGLKGYAMGWMTKSRRGKLYIDNAGWGPEADSIKYRYRVPFGGIHVFIGKIGEPAPEPDICTDIIEMARRASSSPV